MKKTACVFVIVAVFGVSIFAQRGTPAAPPQVRIAQPPSHLTYGTLTDPRDNQTYRTVIMPDGKEWMAENLNFNVADGKGSWCYQNSNFFCNRYGRLYSWRTAMGRSRSSNANPSGVRGVCPAGWHLPSNAEWTALTNAIGGLSTAARKLKSTEGWSNDGNGNDEYGFTALPGGYYFAGTFDNIGDYGIWWTSTEGDRSSAYYRDMYFYNDFLYSYHYNHKDYGFSVRCVKD